MSLAKPMWTVTLWMRQGGRFCFDFQREAMQAVCGASVQLQTVDFAKYEALTNHPSSNRSR